MRIVPRYEITPRGQEPHYTHFRIQDVNGAELHIPRGVFGSNRDISWRFETDDCVRVRVNGLGTRFSDADRVMTFPNGSIFFAHTVRILPDSSMPGVEVVLTSTSLLPGIAASVRHFRVDLGHGQIHGIRRDELEEAVRAGRLHVADWSPTRIRLDVLRNVTFDSLIGGEAIVLLSENRSYFADVIVDMTVSPTVAEDRVVRSVRRQAVLAALREYEVPPVQRAIITAVLNFIPGFEDRQDQNFVVAIQVAVPGNRAPIAVVTSPQADPVPSEAEALSSWHKRLDSPLV